MGNSVNLCPLSHPPPSDDPRVPPSAPSQPLPSDDHRAPPAPPFHPLRFDEHRTPPSLPANSSPESVGPDGESPEAALRDILAGVEDPAALLPVLASMCNVFSLSTVDSLAAFSTDSTAWLLVRVARDQTDPELVTLAFRAVTYLVDARPESARLLVDQGFVPVLCARLLSIEYIDVAEQCLQALEKISAYEPLPCLEEGAIMAVVSYISFFSTSIQRVALSAVLNMCKKIPLDCSDLVMEAIPSLIDFLLSDDRKIAETTASSLMWITKCFSGSSELLDELCKHGLIDHSLQLIAPNGQATIRGDYHTGMIRLLVRLATGSLVAVRSLFELNISSTLKDIVVTCDFSDKKVHDVLKLLNQLIPPVTRDDQDIQQVLAKEKIIMDQPQLLHQFAADIIPMLMQVANSGADLYVCYGCVSVVNSIVYFCTPDMLSDLARNANISSSCGSFLARLLASKNNHLLFSTLKTVEFLLRKNPSVFSSSFVKEGVNYAIDALLVLDDDSQPTAHQSGDTQDTRKETTAKDVSRCLCYAFSSCSHSSSPETKTCKLGEDAVPTLSRHIRATYFTESANSKILQKLKNLCAKLNESCNDGCSENEEHSIDILNQIMKELNRGEALSSFEFIESGAVRSLAHYLSNGKYFHRSSNDHNFSDHVLSVQKRFQRFACMSLPESSQTWEDTPLTSLIRNLQSALSHSDNFLVTLSRASKPKTIHADVPVGCSTVHPCLKVLFEREEEETDLCDYNKPLTIELSSSFDAIEEFLWPKVSAKDDELQALPQGCENQEQQAIISHAGTTSDLAATAEISVSPSNIDRQPKLIFWLKGKQIDRSITLYQAILQDRMSSEPDTKVGRKFWNGVYRVQYTKAREPMVTDSQMSVDNLQSSISWDKVLFSWEKLPFFSSLLVAELPCKLERSNPSYDVLFMLRILEGLNRYSYSLLSCERSKAFAEGRIENFDDLKVKFSSVPWAEFISSKLTNKVEQQMSDPLVLTTGCMPSWCAHLMAACPFLFPFQTRWKYFCLTTFGPTRDYQNGAQHSDGQGLEAFPREKFQVSRNNVLDSAAKMMASNARTEGLIEVEFSGEIGTGLGPTKEFYTLVSLELQKVGLGLWRGDRRPTAAQLHLGANQIVVAPVLFPCPWPTTSLSNGIPFSEVIKKFFLLGQLVARTIKDKRILDLPFARAFSKIIIEQELDIYDIQSFDPELGRTLIELQALVNRRSFVKSHHGEYLRPTIDLSFRGTRIEDLCLEFTLPGYSDYVLVPRSSSEMVDIDNLEEYVSLVVDATVRSGICRQLEAFKSGFNEVFSLEALQIFTEGELERILCGEEDNWDLSEVLDHIKFDHGYTASSPPIISLLEIIQEFGCDQRRAFLQFVTGAPRLPPGGLDALNPKLTIVRKHCSGDVDMELPSVMTCANYLKLPPYSSKERMRQRLLYAITEGQGSFHLS